MTRRVDRKPVCCLLEILRLAKERGRCNGAARMRGSSLGLVNFRAAFEAARQRMFDTKIGLHDCTSHLVCHSRLKRASPESDTILESGRRYCFDQRRNASEGLIVHEPSCNCPFLDVSMPQGPTSNPTDEYSRVSIHGFGISVRKAGQRLWISLVLTYWLICMMLESLHLAEY